MIVGDMNFDGEINILDIVALSNCVLEANCSYGDLNYDGEYNVLDVVTLVNLVLENDF